MFSVLLAAATMFEDAERTAIAMAAAALAGEDNPSGVMGTLPKAPVTLRCTSTSEATGISTGAEVREALELGLAPLMVSPAARWTIDFAKGEVREDGGESLPITDVTRSLIIARQAGATPPRQLILDRMDGHGTLLVSADVSAWSRRRGNAVSSYRTWSLSCQSLEQLF